MSRVRWWIVSSEGRPLRKRFIVRLGRCAGVAVVRDDGIMGNMLRRSMNVDPKGRVGELKVLDTDEERDNSDSERLRFKTMMD